MTHEPLAAVDGDTVTVSRFPAHRSGVRHLCVVENPSCIITTGEDECVRVWTETGVVALCCAVCIDTGAYALRWYVCVTPINVCVVNCRPTAGTARRTAADRFGPLAALHPRARDCGA